MPDLQRRRRSGTAAQEERSWHGWCGVLLQNKETFRQTAHRTDAALEEGVFPPRPLKTRLIGTDGMGIEEADLFGMQPIGDVEHPQAADVVRLVHRVADQPEVMVGRLV